MKSKEEALSWAIGKVGAVMHKPPLKTLSWAESVVSGLSERSTEQLKELADALLDEIDRREDE